MKNNEIKLKPCPFCGGDMITAEMSLAAEEFRIYCISDDNCCCLAEMKISFADAGISSLGNVDFKRVMDIMNNLIDAWNKRKAR